MRRFSVILVVLFLLLSVVGCRQEAEVKLEVAECAHLLSETIAFQDSLTAVSDEMATVLYRLNEADVAAKVYVRQALRQKKLPFLKLLTAGSAY